MLLPFLDWKEKVSTVILILWPYAMNPLSISHKCVVWVPVSVWVQHMTIGQKIVQKLLTGKKNFVLYGSHIRNQLIPNLLLRKYIILPLSFKKLQKNNKKILNTGWNPAGFQPVPASCTHTAQMLVGASFLRIGASMLSTVSQFLEMIVEHLMQKVFLMREGKKRT